MLNHILLASHGSPGAQKAEDLAASWARKTGAKITVLSIINEDWKDMTGDDWLNTSTTRNVFRRYVEEQISNEVDKLWDRLKEKLEGIETGYVRRVGSLENVLCETAREIGADIIVVGTRQKKQAPGFRARLQNKKLHPLLPCPLLTAP